MTLAGLVKRWTELDLLERAVWVAVACLLLVAATVRPVLRTYFPQAAVDVAAWEQAPAFGSDLDPGAGDPWGNPWIRSGLFEPPTHAGYIGGGFGRASHWVYFALRSGGVNGYDDSGVGDDLWPRRPSWWTAIASQRPQFLLALMLVSFVPWIRLKRSASRPTELVRALGATIPATFLGLMVASAVTQGQDPATHATPLVPGPVAVAGSTVVLCCLVALALRLSRPLEEAAAPDHAPAESARGDRRRPPE